MPVETAGFNETWTHTRFRRVEIAQFRNLEAVELWPCERINVISGDNGQGKTSILEALYFLATARSFRTEKLAPLIHHSKKEAGLRATICEDAYDREQRVVVRKTTRMVLLDGKKPERLSDYAVRTPLVVFHPGDLELVGAGAALRRKLLDRIALFLDPSSAETRQRYLFALKGRQSLLESQGTKTRELDVYEAIIAEHGARYALARKRAAETYIPHVREVFLRMAAADTAFEVRYVPRGSLNVAEFARELAERRPRDARQKAASYGPQKDELELILHNQVARGHASQGQQRLLSLAMKVAELVTIRSVRRTHPVLLLDDVSSELDPTRSGKVYELISSTESQVFVTTTRPELFIGDAQIPRRDFVVTAGRIVSA